MSLPPAKRAAAGTPPIAGAGRAKASSRQPWPEWIQDPGIWAVLALLVAVVLAGGGTPIWARGIVLLVTGTWILVRPPKEAPSRFFEIALLTLCAIGLVSSFAPVSWLGRAPWREDLAGLGVILPGTNATAPWLAGEAFAQLLAGLAWLYACWNLRPSHESRKLALWGLAVVTAVLSLGAAVGNLFQKKYPLGLEAMNFSYFPNRNQSALWYCLGGVVAFGLLIEGMHRRRPRFIFAGALLAPCVLALITGRSRMAMALFAFGTVAVLLVRLGRNSGKYIFGVLLPLAILCLALLVFFGDHDTLIRLPGFGEGSSKPEFRLGLWHDTVDLAKSQPAGVGLGQFAQVYPQYRRAALTFQSVRHPDSDWMWLLGETGWAGLTAAALGIVALGKIMLGKEGRASGPYRHLATIAVGLFFLHSLVDVPAHRFGTWLLAAWLLGVAAPDFEKPIRSLVPGLVWRVAGAGLMVAGGLWVAAQAGWATNSTLVEARAQAESDAAAAQNDSDALLAAANAGAAVQPLQWWPYFQRARAELVWRNNPAAALNDFRITRLLEPTWARVPLREGMLWERTNHVQAVAAWREALHRQDDVPEGLWRNVYDELRTWPDGEDYAAILSKANPIYRWEFLAKEVSAKRFPSEWADDLARDPALARFTPEQRHDILVRWAELDGAAALVFLKNHPKLVADAWQIEMSALAAAGRPGEAFQIARVHLPALEIPELATGGAKDIKSLRDRFEADPKNLELSTSLLHAELDAKDFDGALAALQLMSIQPNPPPFVSWWQANLLAQTGKMDEAWIALQPYLQFQLKLKTSSP